MRLLSLLLALLFCSSSAAAQVVITADSGHVQTFLGLGTDREAALPNGIRVGTSPDVRVFPPYAEAQYDSTHYRAGRNMMGSAAMGVYNLGAPDSLRSWTRALGIKLGTGTLERDSITTATVYLPVVNGTGSTLTEVAVGYWLSKFWCGEDGVATDLRFVNSRYVGSGKVGAASEHLDASSMAGCLPLGGKESPMLTGGTGHAGEYFIPPVAPGDTFYVALSFTGSRPEHATVVGLSYLWVTAKGVPLPYTIIPPASERNLWGTQVGGTSVSSLGTFPVIGKRTLDETTQAEISGPHAGDFSVSITQGGFVTMPLNFAWFRPRITFAPSAPGLREAYVTFSDGGSWTDSIHVTALGFDVLFPGVVGEPLLDSLRAHYTPTNVYSYARARDTLFSYVDDGDRSRITDLYVGRMLPIRPGFDPTLEGCNGDKDDNSSTCSGARTINTEHLWPQSLGAESGWPEADMHHLYPSRGDVNSSRGNNPFAWFSYGEATKLYRDTLTFSPGEVGSDTLSYSASKAGAFMPRLNVRGDVARALFYFRTIYAEEATVTQERIDFFEGMKDALLQYVEWDYPDTTETFRSRRVALYQGNENPFVLDTTLVRRAFFTTSTGVDTELPAAILRLHVYPSPARDMVVIEGSGKVEVFDVLGRRVTYSEGERIRLDVSTWPAGLYFVRCARETRAFTVLR